MPFQAGHIYWITFHYIQPPHEKISVCVCPDRPLFFWINTNPKPHGVGQLLVQPGDCDQLRHESYIDLSGLKTGSEFDLNSARYGAPLSERMRAALLSALAQPIPLLPDVHRNLALANLA
jgi:hypothetical protein